MISRESSGSMRAMRSNCSTECGRLGARRISRPKREAGQASSAHQLPRAINNIIRKVGEYSENAAAANFFPARFLFSLPRASATSVSVLFAKRRCLDGQKIKTSDVDSGRCAHLENLRQKEDTSIKHCSIPETNRGGYSAKGLQPWAVPRFTSLMLGLFGP
jgi:hypothetical protein